MRLNLYKPVWENSFSGVKLRILAWLKRFPAFYATVRSGYFGASAGIARLVFTISEPAKYAIGEFGATHRRFVRDGADERVRCSSGLTARSVVIDGGGYRGDWAAALIAGCDPYVTIYEPVPEFHQQIAARFADNPKITIRPVGMAGGNESRSLTLARDASGAFAPSAAETATVEVQMIDVAREFNRFERIDLLKLNIEGGEYEVLARLLDTGCIGKINLLRVQFHRFVPEAAGRYGKIRRQLKRTHRLVWRYPFVWEEWQRKNDDANVGGTRDDAA
jgi:FkbM family methyltransferase